jgi:hypothetical protein
MRKGEVSIVLFLVIFTIVSLVSEVNRQGRVIDDMNMTDIQYDEAYGDDEYRAELARDIDPYDEEDIF